MHRSLRPTPSNHRLCALALLATAILPGCMGGGGGGGGGAGFSGVAGPIGVGRVGVGGGGLALSATNWSSTAEYAASTGLSAIRAAEGYAQITAGAEGGQGVRVGVIDSGIASHPDLDVATQYAIIGVPTVDQAFGNAHGTHVAGTIGARLNGVGMHGVAYNAELVDMPATDYTLPATEWDKIHFGEFWLEAAANNFFDTDVDVINMSWGSSSPNTTLLTHMRAAASNGRIMVIAAGNQSQSNPNYPGQYATDGGVDGHAIVVVATDQANNLASFSNACGAAAAYCMAAPGAAINSTVPTWQDPSGYDEFSGTSMATPHVSGAAAVLIAAFPGVSASDVVNRLLSTATDLGDSAVFGHGLLNMETALSPVGVLSVPVAGGGGAPAGGSGAGATATSAAAATTILLDNFAMTLPSSLRFPDGAVAQLNDVMVLDAQGFPFQAGLGDRITRAERNTGLSRFYTDAPEITRTRVPGLGVATFTVAPPQAPLAFDDDQFGTDFAPDDADALDGATFRFDAELSEDAHVRVSVNRGATDGAGFSAQALPSAATFINGASLFSSHTAWLATGLSAQTGLAFRDSVGERLGGLSAGVFTGEDPETGVTTDLGRVDAVVDLPAMVGVDARLYAEGGVMSENGAFMNTLSSGYFGEDASGETVFGGMGLVFDVDPKTSLFGLYNLGRTTVEGTDNALFTEVTPILSEAFSIGLTRAGVFDDQDAATLTFGQPLRAISGDVSGDLPVGRTPSGSVITEAAAFSLAPEGRELFVEGAYRTPFVFGAAEVAAFGRRHPNHDAAAAPEFGLGLRFVTDF